MSAIMRPSAPFREVAAAPASTVCRTVLTALICAMACFAQGPPPHESDHQLVDRLNKLAEVQKDITKMNTPGASLIATEGSPNKTPLGTMVRYELFAKNLPRDRQYNLSFLKMNGDLMPSGGPKTLDHSGQIMDGPNDPVVLVVMAAKGEPINFVLLSGDGQYRAAVSVVPFPILGSDKDCALEAILLMPNAEAVLVRAKGFEPNASIHFNGDSAGEKHDANLTTNHEGKSSIVLLPYKKGVEKGEMKITVSSASCTPSLQFSWGKGTYQPQ
jgi:hypothetical protein